MSALSFSTLRSYYVSNPVEFMKILNGTSYLSKIYNDLVNNIIEDIVYNYASIESSTIARLDMDGNLMYSNSDAYFGKTKDDVKNVPSRIQKVSASEILVADALKKRAFIIKIASGNYVSAIEDLFVDGLSEEDHDFIAAVFSNSSVVLSLSEIIWEYTSSRYITSFRLMPSIRQIEICDDAIRNSSVFARQGDVIEWINQSSRPVSIYSGTTNYNQFQLNPDLSLYGSDFHSEIIAPGGKYITKIVTVGKYNWFTYPDILTGDVVITNSKINSDDTFVLLESDGLNSPFSSRVIRVDYQGNTLWSFGEGYLVKPRDARPMINGNVIIST